MAYAAWTASTAPQATRGARIHGFSGEKKTLAAISITITAK